MLFFMYNFRNIYKSCNYVLSNTMLVFCIKYKYMLYKFTIFSYNYIIIKKSIVIFIIEKIVYIQLLTIYIKKNKETFYLVLKVLLLY